MVQGCKLTKEVINMSGTDHEVIRYTAEDAYLFDLYQRKKLEIALKNESHPILEKSLRRQIQELNQKVKKYKHKR